MNRAHLHKLFDDNLDMDVAEFVGKCHDCECDVKVEITPGEEGFGVKGGAVYYSESTKKYRLKCDRCYNLAHEIIGEVEVYSRVVGYLSPIKNWNRGKREEFVKRKLFSLKKAGLHQDAACCDHG